MIERLSDPRTLAVRSKQGNEMRPRVVLRRTSVPPDGRSGRPLDWVWVTFALAVVLLTLNAGDSDRRLDLRHQSLDLSGLTADRNEHRSRAACLAQIGPQETFILEP